MKRFIEGEDRSQTVLLPACLDDYIGEDNPVRAVDAFVEELDLKALGFAGAEPAETGRPARRQLHYFIVAPMDLGDRYFRFTPREVSLHLSQHAGTVGAPSMSMSLEPEGLIDIWIGDSNSPLHASWTILIARGDTHSEGAVAANAIGFLCSLDPDEKGVPRSCHAEVAISEAMFATLVAGLESGRIPDTIGLMVSGLQPRRPGSTWPAGITELPIREVSVKSSWPPSDPSNGLMQTNALLQTLGRQLRHIEWLLLLLAVVVLGAAILN